MKSLVIYDSVYGNTEKITRAIAKELDCQALSVTETKLEQLSGLEILIVGSPTRAFKATPAISSFLKQIPKNSLKGVKVAAFDTRIDIGQVNMKFLTIMVGFFGYAAEKISKLLVKKGGQLIAEPEGFFVTDKEGPLATGELERAREWAKQIG